MGGGEGPGRSSIRRVDWRWVMVALALMAIVVVVVLWTSDQMSMVLKTRSGVVPS